MAAQKARLTNSMAVRRVDSAREKMMLQNFQSFGMPCERPPELWADGDGEGSLTKLTILVR